MLRFIWGIFALVGSLVQPPWLSAWVMPNKNHPLTAFVFDISGLMIIIGRTGDECGKCEARKLKGRELTNRGN
jgi:hypothetical protein